MSSKPLQPGLSFADRTVLVIGARGGIGAPLCAALEEAGARVVGVDTAAATAAGHHATWPHLVADLAEPDAGQAVVRQAWAEHGPLDALIHVAGLYPARRALEITEDLFDTVMAVNTRSALFAATSLAELCVKHQRTASIVFTSSGAARRPRPGTTIYAASKATLEAITRGLALELAPFGIRVNAVAPGFVDVKSSLNPIPEDYMEAVQASTPMGRIATPADILPSLMWLCHDSSGWVTGHVLTTDGGAGLGSVTAPSWLAH